LPSYLHQALRNNFLPYEYNALNISEIILLSITLAHFYTFDFVTVKIYYIKGLNVARATIKGEKDEEQE
jgi:hypothetical protein